MELSEYCCVVCTQRCTDFKTGCTGMQITMEKSKVKAGRMNFEWYIGKGQRHVLQVCRVPVVCGGLW